MSDKAHWNAVYQGREVENLSWFEDEPALSMDLIGAPAAPAAHAAPGPAVDVGAGASGLSAALIEAGFAPVTALDLSEAALARARARLGARGAQVEWVVADVTRWQPPRRYTLWHDRAVFHFLTGSEDRAAYLAVLERALAPDGVALIATFAEDGPERCSGLPVMRYAPEALADEIERLLPGRLVPITHRRHLHITPAGAEQRFQFSLFGRA